jgi:hypothetical protein
MTHGPQSTVEPVPEESRRRQHEQRDLRIGVLFGSLAALTLLVLLAALGMKVLESVADARARARETAPSPMMETDVTPPGPRLESSSGQVLRQLHAEEAAELGGYAWIDRESGIARLPIERAMEIIAERDGEMPPMPQAAPQGEQQ